MKYFKYTTWIIVLFSIIFLGLEANNSISQRNALIEAEELATYGSQGKPAKTTIPDDWNIKISGAIEKGINYVIRVSYYSQSDSKLCEDWKLIQFSSDRTSTKLYTYYPEIRNGRHSITIPLKEHDPKTGCKYRIHDVALHLERDKGKHLLPSGNFMLLYAEWVENKLNPPGYGFSRRQIDNNLINIECVFPDPNNIHYSPSPCGLAPVQKHFAVAQRLPIYNANYEVNIKFLSQDEYSE